MRHKRLITQVSGSSAAATLTMDVRKITPMPKVAARPAQHPSPLVQVVLPCLLRRSLPWLAAQLRGGSESYPILSY